MESLLKVNQLTIRFNELEVLSGSTFQVNKGETVGIVGESGSGKSLTALALLGLVPYPGEIKGTIVFEDQELNHPNQFKNLRGKKIGMIFQEPMTSLNPVITVGEQVCETIREHLQLQEHEIYEKTLSLFEKVKLPQPEQTYHKYPHQLSGGQKQRVMIAIAISCNPSLIIADEPTTALDVTVQNTILELLKEIQLSTNMGLLFISHDLAVVSSIADKIMVMQNGKIVEQGATKQMFSDPKNPYTKALISCRPPLNIRYKFLPTVSDYLQDTNKVFSPLIFSKSDRKDQHKNIYKQSPLLEVQNLSVLFPEKKSFLGKVKSWFPAVDKVSFSLYPGETLGIVGESGCGKTTIGKTLVKLLLPSDGEILYLGKDINFFDAHTLVEYRKRVQIIFQDPYSSLNPRKTVGSTIMEVMMVHHLGANNDERKTKTLELLEKVGLKKEHFHRYPHEFSGGQRQRVSIARTLAVEPKIIICDESVSALDASVQAQVLNLLNQLKADLGLTYIFISHDLSVVKFLCDRILVMHKGNIVEEGESDHLYENPKNIYTQTLISAVPKMGRF